MADRKVYFRADGNSALGLGHIFRCLALAEILKERFHCEIIIRSPTEFVRKLVEETCNCTAILETATINEEVNVIKRFLNKDDILIVDHYDLTEEYRKAVQALVGKLVIIDDECSSFISADLIINHATSNMYDDYVRNSNPNTKILTGPAYLIVRKEFIAVAALAKKVNSVKRIAICMGGADPHNITKKAIKAAIKSGMKHIDVITSSAYRHAATLNELTPYLEIKWHSNLSADDLIHIMRNADLAMTTASTIAYEICCAKAGLIIGTVATNQKNIHSNLIENNCAVSAGNFIDVTEDELCLILERMKSVETVNQQMENQLRLIDGLSHQRILSAVTELVHE